MPLPVKLFPKRSLLVLGCIATTLGLPFLDQRPLLIESEESKTAEQNAVYNQIVFKPGLNKDLWVMKQSHNGVSPPNQQWDRIAIQIDKKKGEAKFYQLSPGEFFNVDLTKEIPFQASCFMCHSNGPRAIRPNLESKVVQLGLWDKMRVMAWNLRIKSYGRLESPSKGSEKTPFRFSEAFLNTPLETKTCVTCHSNTGLLARGPLTRQNFLAIRFMLEKGYMPPPGFKLPPEERAQILKFIKGTS